MISFMFAVNTQCRLYVRDEGPGTRPQRTAWA
jgi:hypothetical protein